MSIKICKCTHRKERHLVVDARRKSCKECECEIYVLADEFIRPYGKLIHGSFHSNVVIEHLAKCGIDKQIACLYAVHVPRFGRVRIGKTVNLVYRWVSRMVEWPVLFDVQLIAAIPGAQRHEEEVHSRYHDLRVYSEWFMYSPVIEELAECKVQDDVAALLLEPRRAA